MIVQPVLDKNDQEVLKKIEKRVPVMLVGYEAEKGETRYDLPVIKEDNYEMGQALAEEMLKDFEGNIEEQKNRTSFGVDGFQYAQQPRVWF